MEEMVGREQWRGTDGRREGEEVGRMAGGWCVVGGRGVGLNWKQHFDTIYFRSEHQCCLGVYDVYSRTMAKYNYIRYYTIVQKFLEPQMATFCHRNQAKNFHNFS